MPEANLPPDIIAFEAAFMTIAADAPVDRRIRFPSVAQSS